MPLPLNQRHFSPWSKVSYCDAPGVVIINMYLDNNYAAFEGQPQSVIEPAMEVVVDDDLEEVTMS